MNKTVRPLNPKTQQAHRREVITQIALPLAIGLLLVLALAVWAAVTATQGGNVSQAADASLIFVLIPVMLAALVFLAVLGGLVYLMARLLRWLPPQFFTLQGVFALLQNRVQKAAGKAVAPILWVNSVQATGQALWRTLTGKK